MKIGIYDVRLASTVRLYRETKSERGMFLIIRKRGRFFKTFLLWRQRSARRHNI